MYLEATEHKPGQVARLISPTLPPYYSSKERCFLFSLNAFGPHMGRLVIRDETGYAFAAFNPTGSDRMWASMELKLLKTLVRFVIEGVRGGSTEAEDEGDLAIDDLLVAYRYPKECG